MDIMTTVYFITHPEVIPDPGIPISMWDYTDYGASRWDKILSKLWIKDIEKLYSSPETRAIKAAQRMADSLNYNLHVREDLGPVKRPTDKVLTPEEFAAARGLFYQFSTISNAGWEKAVDAQHRIIVTVDTILQESQNVHHIAVVSHEDLCILLLCHVKQIEIQTIDINDVGAALHYENGACVSWEKLEL